MTWTEQSTDTGGFPGTSTTDWTCRFVSDHEPFHCSGESVFEGSYQGVSDSAAVRLRATCSEDDSTPAVVTCTGRFSLIGEGELEGLRGQGTFASSGVFGVSVRGTAVLRLNEHG